MKAPAVTPMLRHIFEPVQTGIPANTPHRDLMMLPDGEIRSGTGGPGRSPDSVRVIRRTLNGQMKQILEIH